MGHNCSTCRDLNEEAGCCNILCRETEDEWFSLHPSDMHPCEHGTPIVATAIADYRFYEIKRGDIHACHEHDGIVINDAWQYSGRPGWDISWEKRCMECGLKTATADQLEQMYQRSKEDK